MVVRAFGLEALQEVELLRQLNGAVRLNTKQRVDLVAVGSVLPAVRVAAELETLAVGEAKIQLGNLVERVRLTARLPRTLHSRGQHQEVGLRVEQHHQIQLLDLLLITAAVAVEAQVSNLLMAERQFSV